MDEIRPIDFRDPQLLHLVQRDHERHQQGSNTGSGSSRRQQSHDEDLVPDGADSDDPGTYDANALHEESHTDAAAPNAPHIDVSI